MESLYYLLPPIPEFTLTVGDVDVFRRFRTRHSALVSCMDEASDARFFTTFDVLTLYYTEQPVGVASVAAGLNRARNEHRNWYGRIDLVIVDEKFRGFGMGRVLVLGAMAYLLKRFGDSLYCVSSLAAHKAIQTILETELGFTGAIRPEQQFKHESLDIPTGDVLPFYRDVLQSLEKAVRLAAYRLRQHKTRQAESG